VLGVTVLNTVTGCSASPDRPGTGSATPGTAAAGTTGAPGTVAGGWRRVNLSFVSAYLAASLPAG
jgi:hypothetical protein